MKNPLREMSRPKALATAGIVAGVVAIGGVAAALNVGLLTGNDSGRFTPQNVASTDGSVTTTSTEPPVEIVYQDVYEQAPTPAPPATGASAANGRTEDHGDDVGSDDDSSYSDDDSSSSYDDDHESEDEDHESEDDDHGSDDHEDEDDGFDD